MDTIFAVATAPGRAGVAILRVSGGLAFEVVRRLTGSVPDPRKAVLRNIVSRDGSQIDEALVLCFEEGHSFTGEMVAEFQVHGSVSVLRALSNEIVGFEGVRPAEPGEFTRRAVENGQMDLLQAEGLIDLIDAETESQRKLAVEGTTGRLSKLAEVWRTSLIEAVALLEVTIDFSDEEVPDNVLPEVSRLLSEVVAQMKLELSGFSAAERIRSGFEVAIVGRPNVGKSTLLNRLAGRDAAIVSDVAGTTRDVVEVHLDLAGLAVTVLDTAGLRETEDSVERVGVDRAKERAARADLRVCLLDETGAPDIDLQAHDIIVQGKTDLTSGDGISGLTGAGVDGLLADIGRVLGDIVGNPGAVVNRRQRDFVLSACEKLGVLPRMLEDRAFQIDLVSADLRSAISDLERLVGRVDVDDVFDVIFSRFCLGK